VFSLRVLLTNVILTGRTGTEIVTRDIALGLLRRGHRPAVYSPELGPLARELRSASIPVFDTIDAMAEVPDVIHGHHNAPLGVAIARFPNVPAIFVCNDFVAWHDAPPHFPSIRRYVGVDETVADRLRVESGISADRVVVYPTAVDMERFRARPRPLPARPQRALAYVKHTAHLEAVREACAARGIALDVAGTVVGKRLDAPENVLRTYDLVFASALSALEAMASGCAVVVCDARGLAGMVTPESFERWRPLNFGLRALTRRVEMQELVGEIDSYDPAAAADVTALVRRTADMADSVERYIALYRACIAEPQDPDRDGHDRAVARHLQMWGPRVAAEWPWMFEREQLMRGLDSALNRPPRLQAGVSARMGTAEPNFIEYVTGFSFAEEFGRWTDGAEAMMALRVDPARGSVELALLTIAFVPNGSADLQVRVRANGVDAALWTFQHPAGERWNTVRVPVAPSGPGVVVLEFSIDAPRSPSEVGLSGDTRRLGLGVLEVELRAFD
jgi:hypothetical protein